MSLIETLKIGAGITSAFGGISFVAGLTYKLLADRKEPSLTGIIGEAGINSPDVIKILKEFPDAESRTKALAMMLGQRGEEAKLLYAKVQDRINLSKVARANAARTFRYSLIVGGIFIVFAVVLWATQQTLANQPKSTTKAPSSNSIPQLAIDVVSVAGKIRLGLNGKRLHEGGIGRITIRRDQVNGGENVLDADFFRTTASFAIGTPRYVIDVIVGDKSYHLSDEGAQSVAVQTNLWIPVRRMILNVDQSEGIVDFRDIEVFNSMVTTRVPLRKTVTAKLGEIEYKPRHIRGDSDFHTSKNEPMSVQVIGETKMVSNRVEMRVYMHAKEERSDWTEAAGWSNDELVGSRKLFPGLSVLEYQPIGPWKVGYAAPKGWRILSASPLGRDESKINLVGPEPQIISKSGGGPVSQFKIWGDHNGDDVGTYTKTRVVFRDAQIELEQLLD